MLRVLRALLKEDGKELKARFPEITVWKEGGNITLISDPSSAKARYKKTRLQESEFLKRRWISKSNSDNFVHEIRKWAS